MNSTFRLFLLSLCIVGPLACAPLALAQAASGISAERQPPIPLPSDTPYPGTIELSVDIRNVGQRIVSVEQRMPVKPGHLVLLYPRYLPGTHGPYGDVAGIAGLLATTESGQRVEWTRDTSDPAAFHMNVPAGASNLVLRYQWLPATDGRAAVSRNLVNLQWISVTLYPAGHDTSRIRYRAELLMPKGWAAGTALRPESQAEGRVRYQTTSFETLADSPVFAGEHHKEVVLDATAGKPRVALQLFADEASQLEATPEQWQAHKNLVQQSDRLFGARHFRQYDFLFALSDRMGGIGLEHHESSENGVRPNYFSSWKIPSGTASLAITATPTGAVGARELLPHEYVHSWNGKYRRPLDLLTPNFNITMRNSLLWMYEGQTQYWGRVLAVRSGLSTPAQALDQFARVAATAEARAGRVWRNLQDTTNEGSTASRRSTVWRNWQRSADYYDEATLIWLDADTLIRQSTSGQKSLDDFARLFFGGATQKRADGSVQPKPYTFDELTLALAQTTPQISAAQWAKFLRDRLDTHDGGAPLEGLKRSGWRLAWSDSQPDPQKGSDENWRNSDFVYSLGLTINQDGTLWQVMWDSPAFQAGLGANMSVVAVNGRAYKAELLRDAIKANRDGKQPIELLIREGDFYKTTRIDWRGGLRYPKLERIEGAAETLSAVFAPK